MAYRPASGVHLFELANRSNFVWPPLPQKEPCAGVYCLRCTYPTYHTTLSTITKTTMTVCNDTTRVVDSCGGSTDRCVRVHDCMSNSCIMPQRSSKVACSPQQWTGNEGGMDLWQE